MYAPLPLTRDSQCLCVDDVVLWVHSGSVAMWVHIGSVALWVRTGSAESHRQQESSMYWE